MINKLFALLSTVALATPAAATPQSPDYINGGQCAGDAYSKCRYTLEIVDPDETMVVVPGLEFVGASRLSTVEFCAEVEGLGDWRQLITDHDFDAMHGCLVEHT
jgi:hypothetical protein